MRFVLIITCIVLTALAVFLISCGAQPPIAHPARFEFAFCSDIHFGCNHGDEQLKRIIKTWRRQLASVDFLVVAGDLTCNGAEDEFRALKTLFKKLRKPVYTLPGNHDLVSENVESDLNYRKYFGKGSGNYYFEHRGVGLLFLDISDGGRASVTVTEEVGQWLEKKMSRLSIATPVIVFSHFPLHPNTPQYAVRESDLIFSVLDQKNVIGYISGHYHAWWSMQRNGVPFYTAGTLLPAMNNHDASDKHGYYKVVVMGNEIKTEYVELVDRNVVIESENVTGTKNR
jgi:calcineurin-like phosphoesterase family protein